MRQKRAVQASGRRGAARGKRHFQPFQRRHAATAVTGEQQHAGTVAGKLQHSIGV